MKLVGKPPAATVLRSGKVSCSSASGSYLALLPQREASSLSLVLDAVGRVVRGGVDAEKAVKQTLREGSSSGAMAASSARGSAATVIFSVSLWRARLAYVVGQRTAGRPPRGRAFDALLLTLLLASPPEGSILEPSPPTAWLPLLMAEVGAEHSAVYLALRAAPSVVRWPASPVPRLAIQYSLPCGLVRDWSRRLPAAEIESLAAACNARGPTTLRINTELISRERVLAALDGAGVHAEAGRWSPVAVRLVGDRSSWGGSAWSLPGWAEAHFELQDEGSQLIARACEAAPGETVLDVCAGRGGKTLAVAASVGSGGRVISHDVDERALRQLAAAAVRTGIGARVSIFAAGAVGSPTTAAEGDSSAGRISRGGDGSRDAAMAGGGGGSALAGDSRPAWHVGGLEDILHSEPRGVDVVLVDAPCSSSGVLRRHPGLRWSGRWAGEPPRRMAALQLEILCAAAAAVAPGGRLVYATCALEAVDEATADAFEARHPELVPWAFGADEVARATNDAQHPHPHRRTFWPHRLGTDGFFVARWRKMAEDDAV